MTAGSPTSELQELISPSGRGQPVPERESQPRESHECDSGQSAGSGDPRRIARARNALLPYGRQSVDESRHSGRGRNAALRLADDGPKVAEFEEAFAARVGAKHAVSFSSGTAALHAAAFAAGLQARRRGDYYSVDFRRDGELRAVSGCDAGIRGCLRGHAESRSRAGREEDYCEDAGDSSGGLCRASGGFDSILKLARRHGLVVIEDACHALGAEYRGRRVGSIADMTVFSFHPVKHITTGEGGMVTTNNPQFAETLAPLSQSWDLQRCAAAAEPGPVALRDGSAGIQLPAARYCLRAGH